MSNKSLIIGPSWVGDMVMAQAFFKTLKKRFPDMTLDVLAPQWSVALTSRMPEVNHSIPLPFKHGELNLKGRYQLAKQLRSHQYQNCYVLPNSFKSALIPFWARIPERTGWRGEWRYGLLNQVRLLDKQQYPLMVERYVALALPPGETLTRPVPLPELIVDPTTVNGVLNQYGLTRDKPILILCPGAEFGPSKQWPASHYATAANHYLAQGWQVWILGSVKDQPVAAQIQSETHARVVDLTGRTQLGEAIDLMSVADKVLTNDSGLMHIAAALKRPLVAMYGSTSPAFTPPLGQKVRIMQGKLPCQPCFKRHCPLSHHQCMQQLLPAEIIQAADQLGEN